MTGNNRLSHRTVLAVVFASLLILVGLVAIVLINGSSPSLPASNAAVDCRPASGPTARGYGESGAAGAACDPTACAGEASAGATARGYGESGASGVTGTGCDPCPPDAAAGGATGRGYGESGASGVMPSDGACASPADGADGDADAGVAPASASDGPAAGAEPAKQPAPLTGGGGTRDGRVPGAMGGAAAQPSRTTAADANPALDEPLASAVVGRAADEGARRNTALVVGGLVLLLVAVAVVLRRGRPGPTG